MTIHESVAGQQPCPTVRVRVAFADRTQATSEMLNVLCCEAVPVSAAIGRHYSASAGEVTKCPVSSSQLVTPVFQNTKKTR
jgi:hypothetical protein